jgi:hypothetical protein
VCLAVAALASTGVARLGEATAGRARADAVADLVALAAVDGGEPAGRAVARANGATVVRMAPTASGATSVRIALEGVHARAAAAAIGEPLGMSPAADRGDSRIGP